MRLLSSYGTKGSIFCIFPLVYSSLVIPPYADKINKKIEGSKAFADCIARISDYDEDEREERVRNRLRKWSEQIGLEVGLPVSEVSKILRENG